MWATEWFMKAQIEQLKAENKKLKEYWSIEINTCNRYREKSEELEKENKKLKEFNTELNWEYKNSLKQIEEISNNYNYLEKEYNELEKENEDLKLKIEELELLIERNR